LRRFGREKEWFYLKFIFKKCGIITRLCRIFFTKPKNKNGFTG
jgi:hypothetical protein